MLVTILCVVLGRCAIDTGRLALQWAAKGDAVITWLFATWTLVALVAIAWLLRPLLTHLWSARRPAMRA